MKQFKCIVCKKKRRGMKSVDRWKDGKDMFHWWIYNDEKVHPDQTVMFE